jgi:hypothetical protein
MSLASDAAVAIQREALKAGEWELDGRKLSSYTAELLRFTEGSLMEQMDVHAGASLYYRQILERARIALEHYTNDFKGWYANAYTETKMKLDSETTGKRGATVAEIESAIPQLPEYAIKQAEIKKAQIAFNTIQSWVDSWRDKGYALTAVVKRSSGSDDPMPMKEPVEEQK